jgi:uncharacterized membrane protein YraQ (UPF0718 family)
VNAPAPLDGKIAAGRNARRFDAATIAFAGVAAVSGAGLYLMEGGAAVEVAARSAGATIIEIAPLIAAGLLIGGIAQQMVPRERIAAMLGAQSGLRGLGLALGLGMVTPGGPFTSFPLVYALYVAGADIGALVAFLSAWALIGLNRVIVWELPLLGPDLTLLRLCVSLPLPIIAGLIARRVGRHPALTMREAPR